MSLENGLYQWKVSFCNSDTNWESCARFRRSMSGEPVPINLLPNGKEIGSLIGRVAAPALVVAIENSTATPTDADGSPSIPTGIFARLRRLIRGGK
jgi:hypothetical protein